MLRKPFISVAITLLLISMNQSIVASEDAISDVPVTNDIPTANNEEENASSCENTFDVSEMNTCALKAYEISEQKLEETSDVVKKQLNSAEKPWFNKAHRKWNKFRKDYCEFATYALQDEPGYDFHKYDCLDHVTKQYIENLEKYIEDLDV